MSTSRTSRSRICSRGDIKKRTALFAVLSMLLGLSFSGAVIYGSTGTGIGDGISALLAGEFDSTAFRIIFHIRLPRALAALLSGSALAVSGVLIQAVLSNPMAAPNIIGVNSGAGLAAALTVAVFPSALRFLPLFAFVGALAACLFIYAVASVTGAGKLTVTLVGIAVGSVLNSAVNAVKILFPDSVYDADVFMIGGFSDITYGKIIPAACVIVFGLAFACFFAKDTDVLTLGRESASSLGVNVPLLRFVLLVTASALAGAAVSFAGLLGFVGLLVPHIMRRFAGTDHRVLIPASALSGGILVLVCDIFARVAFAPYEIPAGIVLSFAGGIFFVTLVLFGRRRSGCD